MRCGLKLAITLIVQLVIVMHQTQCYAIDGTGKASITPNRGLVAGMSYTFTITYTAGEPDAQVVNGRWNRAVRFTEPFSINYPSRAHLNISEGTIAFWVRPLWDADDGKTHRFFDCFGGRGRQRTRYHISKMSSGVLRFQIFTANRAYDLDFNIGKLWKRGEWHHVVATWRNIGEKHNDAEMHLYVDGHEVGKPIKMRKIPVRTIAPSFCIGAGMIGAREYADADIDELAIYDRAFAPNALPQGPPALEHPHLRFYAPFDGTVIPAKSELPIPRGIAPGGAIRIAIPRTWTPPQNRDPHGAGFVTATASPGTFVDITFGDYRNIEWYIIATIGGKPLTPGKWVRIVYGDRRYGAPGATIQPFPQRRWVNPRNHLGVWVDADGDGAFAELPPQNRYKLEIVAQPTAQFGVFAPSTVAVNEPFRVRVTAFDQFYNDAYPSYTGRVQFELQPKGIITGLPKSYQFTPQDNGTHVFRDVRIAREGCYRLRVWDNKRGIEGISAPIIVMATPPRFRLFWGDLHVHTSMSDGLLTAQESYDAAMRAGLDFAAKSDHAEMTDAEEWRETIEVANRNNKPGEFVTIIGYEWTSGLGHRNVYTPQDRMPIYSAVAPQSDTLAEFFGLLKGKDVVVIPHASLSCMRWDAFEPSICRLIEIYSMWGSSELRNNALWDKGQPGLSAREILARGAALGFIASSDTHDGRPGRGHSLSRFTNLNHRTGIAGVWARSLTRADLFEAMRARRTLGTTGERIYGWLEVNGEPMGSELKVRNLPKLRVHVIGTAPIVRLEIVSNGCVVYAIDPGEKLNVEFSYQPQVMPNRAYYYVRVRQADGNVAWLSPVWLIRSAR